MVVRVKRVLGWVKKVDGIFAACIGGAMAIGGILCAVGGAASPLITAISIVTLIGSTAGAGVIIYLTSERDKRAAERFSNCANCGFGMELTYRAGKRVWLHVLNEKTTCPRYGDGAHPVLPVPISPGHPPK